MKKQFKIFLPIPSVKTLSLGGGGARGAVYAPVLGYLEETDVLSGIECVYGVSAGAITSLLISYGATAEEINELTQTDFRSLLTDWSIFRGGKGIYYTTQLKHMIEENGKRFFLKRLMEAKEICQTNKNEGLLKQIMMLETHQDKITFEDLEKLKNVFNELGFLNKVKSLSVLAVSLADGKPHLFSYSTHKDIRIVDAVAASCAIPPVFKPHYINIGGQEVAFVDGGMYRSLLTPTHQTAFATDLEKRLDSLLLLLLPEDEANMHTYGPGKPLNFIMAFIGYLIKIFFGANGVSGRYEMQKSVKEYGPNVVSMNVDIKPNDFGVSTDRKKAAGEKAVESIKNYFALRRDSDSGYLLEGSFIFCLYQVPLHQFQIAKEELVKQLDAESEEEKNFFISMAQKISDHRTMQKQWEEQISEEIKITIQLLKQNPAEAESAGLNRLNNLLENYCTLPFEMQDQQIFDINRERLLNGTQYQLKELFSLLETQQISLPTGGLLEDLLHNSQIQSLSMG
ncbi:patatin-like phospholipase family protein [Legionella cardiaca]|uniref:Patatin-like phospholipase family protein n=1 Tax=Legionella cardiaca TaxID=1071983 RepID=A0ABY8AU20_9GAMM|nr:patatin-like phospholipase family protein [Legionella cardiaca]WED44190.1 patatin-like phospholipase family protein [Legionella cardiaca]